MTDDLKDALELAQAIIHWKENDLHRVTDAELRLAQALTQAEADLETQKKRYQTLLSAYNEQGVRLARYTTTEA